jgi:cyclase
VDICASRDRRPPDFETIKTLSQKCYVPLTVGGGVTRIEQVDALMNCGADKFAINRTARERPSFITEAAHKYGNQCVVVSIDVWRDAESNLRVFDHVSRRTLDLDPILWAKQVEELGAGELFITSVNRDGTYTGYDIDLIRQIAGAVSIPVIASGGAKNADDFAGVFSLTKATAASAANFFHFSEHSVIIAKAALRRDQSVNVRLETHADYSDSSFNDEHRLLKKDDQTLEDMRFIRIEKEII